ncbi:unnamed protein product [Prorocentrum cordatum]|uniref:Uncharacterized protein n=1 Tax=Prorocentrum cordatum TaxID=2364126 RepID=A0ABN9XUI3_9DINO|nr:unnamed protein product [Polarella glacialis]
MDWPRADGRLASLTAQQRAGVDAGASGGRPEAPGWCSAPAWQVDFGCGHPCPVSLLTPRKVSLREPAAFAFRTQAVVALGPELAAAGAMACGAHAGGPKRPRGPLPGARAAGSLGGAVGGEIVGYLSCSGAWKRSKRSSLPIDFSVPSQQQQSKFWGKGWRSYGKDNGGAADVPGAGLRATEPAGPGGREGLDPVPPDPIRRRARPRGRRRRPWAAGSGGRWRPCGAARGPGRCPSSSTRTARTDWMIEGFTDCCSLFWGGRWAGEAAAPTQGGGPGLVDARGLPPEERSLREWIKPKQRDPFCRWVRAALAEPGAAAAPAPPRAFGEPLALRPPSLRHGRLQLVASVALPPPAGRGQRPGAAVRLLFEDIALRQIRRLPEGSRPGGRGRAQ